MSNPDFRIAIRNQALSVKGDTLAGQIQKSSTETLRKELAESLGLRPGHVKGVAAKLSPEKIQQRPGPAGKLEPKDMNPEQLVEVFTPACEAALMAIYQGVQLWSTMTMMTGVTSTANIAIGSAGSLKPRPATVDLLSAQSQMHDLPDWGKTFSNKLAKGFDNALSNWMSTFSIDGLPLFPSAGPNIPWLVSAARHAPDLLSATVIDNMMLSAGATVPGLLVSEYARSGQIHVDQAARSYTARMAAGMIRFSFLTSYIRNLVRVLPVGPTTPVSPVISSPGVLADIGRNLPNPTKWSVNGCPASDVDLALREDLKDVALGAVHGSYDVPNAPKPPGK